MTYTHGHAPGALAAHGTRTIQNSCAYLLPFISPNMRVLDVGCGPGSITAGLAELAPDTTGIDPSETAIAAAQASYPHVNFRVAPLETMQGNWDIVHAHQVLQHLAHPIAALQRMRELCAPDGIVAARDVDYAMMTWFPHNPGIELWLSVYRQLARSNGGEPDAGRRLKEWALAAGFSSVDVTVSNWSYTTTEACTWLASTWATRIQEEDFRRQVLNARFATDEDITAMARGWLQWAQHPAAWFSMTHSELIARP